MDYDLANHAKFKKDISNRLAHKEIYKYIDRTPDKQLHLLIVVDQMLTGFDSRWINTLYMDKVLKYEAIIQAFSRTNRLFGPDKPFGTIRYYRYPHTMERNIGDAVKLYSGDKPIGLFVEQLDKNLKKMNSILTEISAVFTNAHVENFTKLPDESADKGQFAKLYKIFNMHFEAAKVQGFTWQKSTYEFQNEETLEKESVTVSFDETTYLILAQRYKELFNEGEGAGSNDSIPYEIDGYLTEIDTGHIDTEYMNSNFEKYLKVLNQDGGDSKELQLTLNELHKSFATLTQEEQKYANIFLHDVQRGDANLKSGKTFREYITEYQSRAKDDQVNRLHEVLGLDKEKLVALMKSSVNESNLNEFGRFDELKNTVDKTKAKSYFDQLEGGTIPPFKVNIRVHNLLEKFIISSGFEIEMPKG